MRRSRAYTTHGVLWSRPVGTVAVVVSGALAVIAACSKNEKNDGSDPQMAIRGSVEVTARLIEIAGLEDYNGSLPGTELGYDYAWVMKYRVLERHRGEVGQDEILVAHYRPYLPRSQSADPVTPGCEELGGTVESFLAGDVHRLALEVPYDEYSMATLINPYHDQTGDPIHWCVLANEVDR